MSELVEEFPQILYGSKNIKFKTEGEREEVLLSIEKKSKKFGKINKMDGIKVIMKDGFMLFRKSNTEPILRAYYEGLNKKRFEEISSIVNNLIGR